MQRGETMNELVVAIEIRASAEEVWRTLVDFARYGAWNPFIRRARGAAAVGVEVRVRAQSSLGVPLRFRATVLVCEPNRELRWRGHVIAPWIAAGEHAFVIEPQGEGRVRFVQRERFSGLLPPLLAPLVVGEARRGFDAMNRALKARVERADNASARTSRAPI